MGEICLRTAHFTLVDNHDKPFVETRGIDGVEVRSYLPHKCCSALINATKRAGISLSECSVTLQRVALELNPLPLLIRRERTGTGSTTMHTRSALR
jgi:hypothetical protein